MKNNKSRYMLALSMMLLMGLFVISCGSKDVNPPPPNVTEDGQTGTVSTIEGTGYVEVVDVDENSFNGRADLALDVDTAALSEGHLSFSYETETLQDSTTTITSVSLSASGDVIIEGSGTAEYVDDGTSYTEDCTFTLTLTDSDADGIPETASIEIISSVDGEVMVITNPEPLNAESTITITY